MTNKANFKNLGISDYLIAKLAKNNILVPTAIQAKLIPRLLDGQDVIGQSPTGTGKTLAYLLPIIMQLDAASKNVQALILAPTRELAMQITNLANSLTEETGILTVPILGEANTARQLDNLKKKPQLIVGTPGRILDFIKLRKISSHTIKIIVIDEVDKMWKKGFKEDTWAIIKSTLRNRQIIMVSATIPPYLLSSAAEILNNPIEIKVEPESAIPRAIKHIFFMSKEVNKSALLQKLIKLYQPSKAIIFINSNEGILPFVRRFKEFGFSAEGLHSELRQQERKQVLEQFRSGKNRLLVTTDLFARGMDVKEVEIVFNFDLPNNDEYYLHRVGRTGRAGLAGLAINFVTPAQKFIMAKYEKKLKVKIEEYGISDNHGNPQVFPVKYNKMPNRK